MIANANSHLILGAVQMQFAIASTGATQTWPGLAPSTDAGLDAATLNENVLLHSIAVVKGTGTNVTAAGLFLNGCLVAGGRQDSNMEIVFIERNLIKPAGLAFGFHCTHGIEVFMNFTVLP